MIVDRLIFALLLFASGILIYTTDVFAQVDLQRQLQEEQAALDSLKAKMAADQKRLKQTRTKQRFESEALEGLERDMLRVRGELRGVERVERELHNRVRATGKEVSIVETRMESREIGIASRLREMYKLGRRGPLEILFSSASFPEAFRRLRYLSRVADQDRRDYEGIRADRKKSNDFLNLQRTQYARQQALLKAKEQKENSLKNMVSVKATTLQQLRNDESARQKAIKESQEKQAESEAKLAEIIQTIQRQRLGGRLDALPDFDFAAQRGSLQPPVTGKVVVQFGRQQDPDLKTWTFNRGINLAAPEGTDVRAVAPGEVVLVDWFPGYGRFVLLRHPDDYFTLYGHLADVSDRVEVGAILADASLVGTVGSTGRLDGKPQLHFELMKGEEPLDPESWLGSGD